MAETKRVAHIDDLEISIKTERAKTPRGKDRIWIKVRPKGKDPLYSISAAMIYRHAFDICFTEKKDK